MKMLVHYNSQRTRAYGVWWLDIDDTVSCLYTEPNSPMAARGNVLMYAKDNPAMSWEQWFDEMTTRAPYLDDWEQYDSMGFSPMEMLSAVSVSEPLVS